MSAYLEFYKQVVRDHQNAKQDLRMASTELTYAQKVHTDAIEVERRLNIMQTELERFGEVQDYKLEQTKQADEVEVDAAPNVGKINQATGKL